MALVGEAGALERALDALEASRLSQLLQPLLTAAAPTDDERCAPFAAECARLEALLASADASELLRARHSSARVAKELSRAAARLLSLPDAVARLPRLDAPLCHLLRPVAALADRAAGVAELREPAELARWLPFALSATSFSLAACEQLPTGELAASAGVAARLVAAGGALAGGGSIEGAMATYAAQLVALSSQGASKEQWVDPQSLGKHALRWVITRVSFPHLGGDLLGRVLALAFPLIDDLRDETQRVGAQILRHVVINVTPTELRWYSDVLLEVLRTSLTSRKPVTLDCLLECLTESLAKVSSPGDVKNYDQFLPRLLSDVSLCNDTPIRTIYLRRLRPFIKHMGAPHSLHLVRYLQPLLKVIVASFDAIDVDLLLEALETLRATVTGAWPRIPAHTEEILVGTMRVVAYCELFDDPASSHAPSPEQKKKLLAASGEVLVLLHDLDVTRVLTMLKTVGDECTGLKRFTDSTTSRLTGCQP